VPVLGVESEGIRFTRDHRGDDRLPRIQARLRLRRNGEPKQAEAEDTFITSLHKTMITQLRPFVNTYL